MNADAIAERSRELIPSSLMTIPDIAAELCCSERHIRRLIDRGAFCKPIRLGSLIRIRRVDFEQWLADGCPSVRKTRKGIQR